MSHPMPMKILGLGRYAPKRVVKNEELEPRIGKPAGWIEEKQGIRERRWVDGETASEMAALAAREALDDARMNLSDVELILNASGTAEQAIPDGGALAQRALGAGMSGIPAMSVHTTCLSFLTGLDTAASLIAAGRYSSILIVTADITSCGLNFDHPESSTLFGDAAAAVVVGRPREGEASCVHAARLETFGDGAEFTEVRGAGTRRHPNAEHTRPEDNLFFMDGRQVFRMAHRQAPAYLERLYPGLSKGLADVDLVIPHQPSKRGVQSLKYFGWPEDRIVSTLETWGNCVAASIPVTLYEAVKTGRLERGDKALLFGTGAGLSLGGLVLTY